MSKLLNKYGPYALIAGGSEGLGAAFARYLAREGFSLVLVARREEKLQAFSQSIQAEFPVEVLRIQADLADSQAPNKIYEAVKDLPVHLLVYNAALSYIGPFEENTPEQHLQLGRANMQTPMHLLQLLSQNMLSQCRGGILLMSSMAGNQGSGFLSAYAASKAFNRILAESLWYEWKDRGVDVLACCAGATSTPNYLDSKPAPSSPLAPKVQSPEAVVKECFQKIGKVPSFISGSGNRWASFFMHRILPRKMAIKIMGDTTRKIYRIPKKK